MQLQDLIIQVQTLIGEIKQHPQFKSLQLDADVTMGDVVQYLNTLRWEASNNFLDTSKEGFNS